MRKSAVHKNTGTQEHYNRKDKRTGESPVFSFEKLV